MAHFIANLFLNGIGSPEYEYKRYQQALETWYAFSDKFSELWRNESKRSLIHKLMAIYLILLEEIFSDMLGYAGCELIRRAIGIAQIDDLNHEQDEQKRMERRKE